MGTLLMALTPQTGAVNHRFLAYTTIEWCISSQIIRETRGEVAVVTKICVIEAVSEYTAAHYVLW